MGGLSEAIEICHMASAAGLPAIPHSNDTPRSLYLVHGQRELPVGKDLRTVVPSPPARASTKDRGPSRGTRCGHGVLIRLETGEDDVLAGTAPAPAATTGEGLYARQQAGVQPLGSGGYD